MRHYRGKISDNGHWVFGSLLIFSNNIVCIMPTQEHENKQALIFYEVDPATVGQFAGKKDKNGDEIFKGDIIRYYSPENERSMVGVVDFVNGSFGVEDGEPLFGVTNIEIIGNKFNNPELLED